MRFPKRFKVRTDSDHREAISPSKLNRYFDVFEPGKVWTTGITYVWIHEGWLCVAIVIDLFSRLVYGLITCAHHCVLMHYKWPSDEESQNLGYGITPTEGTICEPGIPSVFKYYANGGKH